MARLPEREIFLNAWAWARDTAKRLRHTVAEQAAPLIRRAWSTDRSARTRRPLVARVAARTGATLQFTGALCVAAGIHVLGLALLQPAGGYGIAATNAGPSVAEASIRDAYVAFVQPLSPATGTRDWPLGPTQGLNPVERHAALTLETPGEAPFAAPASVAVNPFALDGEGQLVFLPRAKPQGVAPPRTVRTTKRPRRANARTRQPRPVERFTRVFDRLPRMKRVPDATSARFTKRRRTNDR